MSHLGHRQRFVALISTSVIVLLVLAGLTWLLLRPSNNDPEAAPSQDTTTTTLAPTATTTTTPTQLATEDRSGDGGDGADDWEEPQTVPLPPMGIDTTDFDWTTIDLPAISDGAWINQLIELDDRLLAIGGTWNEGVDREELLMWESRDALTWELIDLPALLEGHAYMSFIPTEVGLVAFSNDWDEETGRILFSALLSQDGINWTELDLSDFVADTENAWISYAAGTGDQLLLAGTREPFYPYPPDDPPIIVIEKDGMTLELDEATWSFLLTDSATGEVLLHGSQERIWDYSDEFDGYAIYDPVSGELYFSTGWEKLNSAAQQAYAETQFGNGLVVEVVEAGKMMAIDQWSGDLTITELATGTVIYEGTEEDLWRGKPPTIINPRTDEVLMTIGWDEWDAAHQAVYGYEGEHPDEYFTEALLLRSEDSGESWSEVDIAGVAGEGFWFVDLTLGPDGYLALGNQQLPYAEHEGLDTAPIVLRSNDGQVWEKVATDLASTGWIHGLLATDDGYLAVFGGEDGTRIIESADGAHWTVVLEESDLLLPLGSAYFDRMAVGEPGRFVTGSRDGYGYDEPEPVPGVIAKQGRTLTIDFPTYTLTEDLTGDVLLRYDESDYHSHEYPSDRTGMHWGNGGIAIFDSDGSVLFAASHDEYEEAVSHMWSEPDVWYESENFLLYDDGQGWKSVLMPDTLGRHSWFSGMKVFDGRLVISTVAEEHHPHLGYKQNLMILVGVPS